ncbi:MAG: hypothetical protein ACOC2W_02225 [bacterium]
MREITQKIYNLLKDNKIKEENMTHKLELAIKELNSILWENIVVNPALFYSLKDIIWYNFEHLPAGGEEKGISDLRYLGSKCPYLIECGNSSDVVLIENIEKLLNEIELIINSWNKDWKFASLYTRSPNGWQGGKDPSQVIIYDKKTESPSKYGYNTNYGSIVDSKGNKIKKFDDYVVLCSLGQSIGEFSHGTMLYQLLTKLKQGCMKAINNEKNIKINFKQA